MRLLSKNEMGILQGDLRKISLPAASTLYISLGLACVFRRINIDSLDHFENSWLYFPMELMNSIRQNLIVAGKSPLQNYISKQPIAIDDYNLFPILIQGSIIGIITVKTKKRLGLNKKSSSELIDSLITFKENQKINQEDIINKFISNLFQVDNTFEKFNKHLLFLFTEQYDNSYCGLYYKYEDKYTLRISVGDLNKFDQLPGKLSIDTARRWIDCIKQKDYFTPAELLPSYPVFLTAPPDFIFVHESIKSERSDYIVALTIGGDIEIGSIEKILKLAKYSSKLNENQFLKSTEILSLYNSLITFEDKQKSFNEIFLEVFKFLKSKMSISRIVIANPDGNSKVILDKQDTEPEVVLTKEGYIDNTVYNHLSNEEYLFVPYVLKQKINENQAILFESDNVKSEIYFTIRLENNKCLLLAIGSPKEGDYLIFFNKLLIRIKHFMQHLCLLRSENCIADLLINDNEQILFDEILKITDR